MSGRLKNEDDIELVWYFLEIREAISDTEAEKGYLESNDV